MTLNLTPREAQVVQLICQGLCNKEIVAQLNISLKTVATHRMNIMRKLGVDNAVKVVLWAMGNPQVNLTHISRRVVRNESQTHCHL